MSRELLPRSTPSREGIASDGIAALLDRLEARSIECHSLVVARHGRVVAEGWWAPYSAGRPHLLYSLTKSFTAIAVGLAIADGRLALTDRVVDVLPEHVPAGISPRARQLTVEHLLTMTTGHRADTLAEAWTLEPADLVKGFLRVPLPDPAGERHAYDNPTTFVLARMVERVTGLGLPELLDRRLFAPMGIERAEWDRVASGKVFGFHGLHLTTEAVAAFGELLLRGGRWGEEQLVPRDWVELATRRHVETLQFEDGSRTADWLAGYGYQFWMSRHGYRGDGAYGQCCLVLPEHDLVVATTAATTDTQALLDAVWDCLLPAVDRAGEDDRALADRLRRLSLPLVPGSPPDGRSAVAVIDATAVDSALPHGTPVSVRPEAGGWRVRFDIADGPITIDVGHRTWRGSTAVGAWQGAAFVADLCVISGPHRVRLVVEAARATATWHTVPLVGPDLLRQLRSPLMTRPDVA